MLANDARLYKCGAQCVANHAQWDTSITLRYQHIIKVPPSQVKNLWIRACTTRSYVNVMYNPVTGAVT